MSEAKDPAIKLFGKTIPVPEVHANGSGECSGAPAACSGPVVDDSIDQDRSSSSNSSVEADKVCVWWDIGIWVFELKKIGFWERPIIFKVEKNNGSVLVLFGFCLIDLGMVNGGLVFVS